MSRRVLRRGWRALLPMLFLAAFVPATGMVTGPCARAAAAGENHAAVVVQFAEDSVREFCVSFEEETLGGFELLRRTGLAVTYKDSGGGAIAICRIESVGCDHPSRPCFCECENTGACAFWGYYRLDPATGEWQFSDTGTGETLVRPGDVEGWRWGNHDRKDGFPRETTLEGVCERGEQVRAELAAPASGPLRSTTRSASGAATAAVAGILTIALATWRRRLARARRGNSENG